MKLKDAWLAVQSSFVVQRWLRWLRQARQWLPPNQLATLEACLIGLVSGLAAVALKQGATLINLWRTAEVVATPRWLWFPLVGLLGGLLAGFLTERLAPETTGSGIPHVKAALSRVPVALNLRVALIKLCSTMLVVGSGMALGRQGPTVQVGAAIAGQLSRWVPTSPDHRRQMIAAGAAAGLAAGFNAPIAGVLFVIEELLQDVSGLTLGTAILASFTGSVVSRLLGGQGLGFLITIAANPLNLSIEELPLLLLLGTLAGTFGGIFCRGIVASRRLYKRFFPVSLAWRVGMAGLISGLAILVLPLPFQDNVSLRDFLVRGDANWHFAALAFSSRFVLTLVATGSGASGGLFAPALILGAALGYMQISMIQALYDFAWFPQDLMIPIQSPVTYALTGMGAFFSAVTKNPITAIVIVFEMTSDFDLVLPLMIGSVVAYGLSEQIFTGSIYDRLQAMAPENQRRSNTRTAEFWEQLTAGDVMQQRVETLAANLSLREAREAFAQSHHRGFPIVSDGHLVGILTQSDLDELAKADLDQVSIRDLMTTQPVSVQSRDTLAHVLHLLSRYQISRLPVLEERKLVGIITRADIIRAESAHLSGQTQRVGPAMEPSYVVYQTRAPATGQGRILVPISNPQSAPTLLQLAGAIAREKNYELECVQILIVPRGRSPAETPVDITQSRQLLDWAVQLGDEWQVPVHTQIRVAYSLAPAILETVRERHINLLIMGWKGSTHNPERIFGTAIDTLIRQAACDLMLIKLSQRLSKIHTQYPSLITRLHFNRWLMPLAGGPNSRQALGLLPALISVSSTPEIELCQVFPPSATQAHLSVLEESQTFLKRHLTCPISSFPLRSSDVALAILDQIEKHACDVLVLGASRESLLQRALHGSIPETIIRNSRCTVILVRILK